MARSGRSGSKTGSPRKSSKPVAGHDEKGPADDSPVQESTGSGGKPVETSGAVIPPTPSPGAPPKKRRGRKPKAEIEAEQKAAEIKAKAEEQAKRDKQAEEITPILSGALKYVSRLTSEDKKVSKWAMTDAEAESISGASAAVLAKYVDLESLNRWKEEITLAVAVGSYVATRVDLFTEGVPESKQDEGDHATV